MEIDEALETAEDLLRELEAAQEREESLKHQVKKLQHENHGLSLEMGELVEALHLAATKLQEAEGQCQVAETKRLDAEKIAAKELEKATAMEQKLKSMQMELSKERREKRAALKEVDLLQIALESKLNEMDQESSFKDMMKLMEAQMRELYVEIDCKEKSNTSESELPPPPFEKPKVSSSDEEDDENDLILPNRTGWHRSHKQRSREIKEPGAPLISEPSNPPPIPTKPKSLSLMKKRKTKPLRKLMIGSKKNTESSSTDRMETVEEVCSDVWCYKVGNKQNNSESDDSPSEEKREQQEKPSSVYLDSIFVNIQGNQLQVPPGYIEHQS